MINMLKISLLIICTFVHSVQAYDIEEKQGVHKPTILVTGGAGYIGSHTSFLMKQNGYNVVILDHNKNNLAHTQSWAKTIEGDYGDEALLHSIFTQYSIDAVMHFAGFIEVGESVKNPLSFYQNNVSKTITLLQVMLAHNIKTFIFSSSCAVYGTPQWIPLTEDHPRDPISPYGKTKYMIEMILEDVHNAHELNFVALRYFNAAGALPEHNLGERHVPETHLIPLLINASYHNKTFKIFGTDYPTEDGTCIRDYLHVLDIAEAHRLALEYLNHGGESGFFNLGTGTGTSVQQMVDAVQRIIKSEPAIILADRRPGDPAILVANSSHVRNILGWKPNYSNLDNILKTAYDFYILNT